MFFDDERLNNLVMYKTYMTDAEMERFGQFLATVAFPSCLALYGLYLLFCAVRKRFPKFKAFCKSFYKNVIVRRKYRSFWILLTNSKFRADLNRLHALVKDKKKVVRRKVLSCKLVPGHQLIYPGYATSLIGKEFPPIRVVYDKSIRKYVIVDGNHRLPAIIESGAAYVLVEVMT